MAEKIPSGQCTANVTVTNEGVDVRVAGFELPANAKQIVSALFGGGAFVDEEGGRHFGFTLGSNQSWQAEVRAQLKSVLKVMAIDAGATDLKVFYRVSLAYEDDLITF